jgi:FMN phosphatase YigB (HAD superfamily)
MQFVIRAVLLDVGGTLWPEHLPGSGLDLVTNALTRLLPTVQPAHALAVLREYLRRDTGFEQHAHLLLGEALRSLYRVMPNADPAEVRRALCVPAISSLRPFPGTSELLEDLQARGIRRIVVSNVQVRGAREYQCDFEDFGIAHLIDAIVTSLEVGFRKPHPAICAAALLEARCAPEECVMVGNSEENDIQPAIERGMGAIRVAIEEPLPQSSAAHGVASNLSAVSELLRRWADLKPQIRRPFEADHTGARGIADRPLGDE